MTPRIVDKERKADEIARAALRVFGERGFHHTRMADIAAAAGVGKGTVYEYFDDKREILRRELDRYFDDFRAGAATAVAAADGAPARLAALVTFALGRVAGWADHCAAFFDAVGSARAEGLGHEWFEALFTESRGLVHAILAEGMAGGEVRADLDAEATAEAVVALYEGYVLLAVLDVRCCSEARVRAAMLALLDEGLVRR